jgi:hypothetical protein
LVDIVRKIDQKENEMSATVTELTQTVQEQTLAAIRQGQQAIVEGVRVWAAAAESTVPSVPAVPFAAELPTPHELLVSSFGFAQQLLDTQREFVEGLLAAASPVRDQATKGQEN